MTGFLQLWPLGPLAGPVAAALLLTACGDQLPPATEESATPATIPHTGSRTVATLVAGDDSLDRVEEIMSDSGLADAFDGTPSYTLFAPTDAALAELEEAFSDADAQPALLAIMREHIVPGYLTIEDIAQAVQAAEGEVSMQTMGDTVLTFSLEDDVLVVNSADGTVRSATTRELAGANGVVIPVDQVLKAIPAAMVAEAEAATDQ